MENMQDGIRFTVGDCLEAGYARLRGAKTFIGGLIKFNQGPTLWGEKGSCYFVRHVIELRPQSPPFNSAVHPEGIDSFPTSSPLVFPSYILSG
jgi:hypothetical protein